MYTILSLRVLVSIALIAFQFLGIHIWGIIIGCIIAVLNLVFIFWCLAMIERAEGVRHVCGLRVVSSSLSPEIESQPLSCSFACVPGDR